MQNRYIFLIGYKKTTTGKKLDEYINGKILQTLKEKQKTNLKQNGKTYKATRWHYIHYRFCLQGNWPVASFLDFSIEAAAISAAYSLHNTPSDHGNWCHLYIAKC